MKCPSSTASGCLRSCSICLGRGSFDLTPETAWLLPAVERMEIDHFYLNSENVYLHPLASLTTMIGAAVVLERFYRPANRSWVERASRHRYRTPLVLPSDWTAGAPWQDVVVLPQRSLVCPRHVPTREISYDDWLKAQECPTIWRRDP